MSGSVAAASERANAMSSTAAPRMEPMTTGELQPSWIPSDGASRSSETPTVSVRLPIQLRRCTRGSMCSCSTAAIRPAASRPTGTLM